ncbi:MAG TPA: WYL domain-containing protein, partial [Spirochaetia bacterium]|nr:WYL domain-containing protein [Spirochaetia bacterium]
MNWEAGKSYRIWYRSESGRVTERTIELLRVSRASDGRVFLKAFCHLRGEERTFRADRVLRSECLTVLVSAVSSTSTAIERPATVPVSSAASFIPPRLEPVTTTLARLAVHDSSLTAEVQRPAASRTKPRKTFGEVIG